MKIIRLNSYQKIFYVFFLSKSDELEIGNAYYTIFVPARDTDNRLII